ncbi:Cof-type HAD-IIB family hydrolase [Haloimpatiens lingqiaonensis]|uniref:Cof-type HAD-IIB family hydrolase n=1 Tax=Haloimpatiens lingqiaonensis TaxID=1380675 RepID=UPI0010FEB6A3|nr:Cof-type HAD-IIB family hydrolase [Haloimpatiens lingqiaonensis]
MNNMKYKLLALDMDGTLLNSESRLEKENIESIKKCLDKGVKVVLASGREFNAIKKYVDKLNITEELVTINGAVIVRAENKQIVKIHTMDKKMCKEIISKLREENISYIVFDKENSYVDKENSEFEYIREKSIAVCLNVQDCNDIEDITKIVGVCFTEEEKNKFNKIIKPYNVPVMQTGTYYFEIGNEDISKKYAIEYIAKINNIKREEVIAVGDSENDIEMIKYAGLGVAMGNAYDNVKKISDYVTDTNDNHGVSKVIEKFILV